MTKVITTVFLSLLFFACTNNKTINTNKDNDATQGKEKLTSGTISDTLSEINEEEKAMKGNFVVNNTNFRYTIVDDECIIEKQEGNNWERVLSYTYSHRTDSLFADVNNDGYADIINSWRWNDDVYLFNPDKKSYDTTNMVQLENQWVLIDSVNNIYCSLLEGKRRADKSFLYTFDKLDQKILFSIDFQTKKADKEDWSELIVGYKLYEGVNTEDGKEHMIRQVKCSPQMEFDYEAFWKKNYKELLHLN